MVRISKTYYCSKCGKPYRSFDTAEKCELEHLTQEAVDGFREDLAAILRPNTGERND
jgi:hypothetical protein